MGGKGIRTDGALLNFSPFALESGRPVRIPSPAEHTRGTVLSHRDWLKADAARARIKQQWSLFFREWDVVLCPPASVPAFPHDHSLPIEARHLTIDGNGYPFYDACFVWADPAGTCGLLATAAPIGRSPTGLPIGVQIIGPYLEDRTTIAFAEHLEREFAGFVPPLGVCGLATGR